MELRNSMMVALILAVTCSVAVAYDPLDPNGNITMKWDVISWTADGYVAMVTMNNYQMYRQIMAPGWTVGWSWAKKEVIWSIVGAQATEQGDCSKFKGGIPHSCKRTPTIVDLLPGVPYNQQIANCCKGGVISAYGQDPAGALSAFQVSVGLSGTTNKTVKLPMNFTLMGPGLGYSCGPATIVPSTVYLTPDHRRKTQALMTWTVTCTYSQQLASRYPTCCVSFSSFYNSTIVPCAKCACGCGHGGGGGGGHSHGHGHGHGHGSGHSDGSKSSCVMGDSKRALSPGVNTPRKDGAALLQCTSHMCPIRVHWHVKLNYKDYWRAKIAITNFNYRMNYTQWTLAAQHPNLNNVTEVFSFQYKPLLPFGNINDTGMFYGLKLYNDLLMEAGPFGNVQSELLMRKDDNTFTFSQGWAFPRKIYFNGDECKMPPPDSYPYLPSSAPLAPPRSTIATAAASAFLLVLLLVA